MSDGPTGTDDGASSTRWPLIVGIALITAGLVAALVFVNADDDDNDTVATSDGRTTQSSTPVTEATGAPTTEATAPPTDAPVTAPTDSEPNGTVPSSETRDAIWPLADTTTRFDDPVAAVTSFAVEYLGFTDPVIGEFQEGDARSGEVEVRAVDVGPPTRVLVRQLTDDDTWWVVGFSRAGVPPTTVG
jgi:hypothetical protein